MHYLLLYLPLLQHFWRQCEVWRTQGPSAGPHLCFWQVWYESFLHLQWQLLAKGDEIPSELFQSHLLSVENHVPYPSCFSFVMLRFIKWMVQTFGTSSCKATKAVKACKSKFSAYLPAALHSKWLYTSSQGVAVDFHLQSSCLGIASVS